MPNRTTDVPALPKLVAHELNNTAHSTWQTSKLRITHMSPIEVSNTLTIHAYGQQVQMPR